MSKKTNKENKTNSFKEISRGEISLLNIVVDGNFRKDFNEAKLSELAANIAKVGILQPIIVRPCNVIKNKKILVAGERRLRAAALAGLKAIPYRELDLTEAEALEVMALENLHRSDLNPIEEAQAFKALLDSGGYDVDALAARVDKSKSYVYRSLKLLDLPKAALDALLEGKITPAHGAQLLRLKAQDAEELLEDIIEDSLSVRDVADKIKWSFGFDLKSVNFPKNKNYADMPPCTKCLQNTNNQQSLFDEEVERGGCTNKACFEKKKAKYFEDIENELKANADKGGMKYIGARDFVPSWRSDIDGYHILKDDLKDKFKKEFEKSPEKFGVVYNKEDSTNVIVIVDEALKQKAEEFAQEQCAEEEDTEQADPEADKNDFIEEQTGLLLQEKLIPELRKIEVTEEEFDNIAEEYFGDYKEVLAKVMGLKEISLEEVLSLSTLDVLRLFVVANNLVWNWKEKLAEANGLDYKQLEAEAKEQAEALWEKECDRSDRQDAE